MHRLTGRKVTGETKVSELPIRIAEVNQQHHLSVIQEMAAQVHQGEQKAVLKQERLRKVSQQQM